MIVTFISQCEKKALPRTRRVLDAFANRIGDNTWQTVITEDGLAMVKKLLSATASKSTAVSCYRFHTRKHSELLWIVGNRHKFNEWGWVPVNITEQDISNFYDNYQWNNKGIMRAAVAIAGLFHDIGKANYLFQKKLNPKIKTEKFEPYRHEWVSLRLFEAIAKDCQTDSEWLDKLINGQFDAFDNIIQDGIDELSNSNPLQTLSHLPLAQLVAWLIVAHHKLPVYPAWKHFKQPSLSEQDKWIGYYFEALWNSPNCLDKDQQFRIPDNWKFAEKSLPCHSPIWRAIVCDYADQAKKQLLSSSFGNLHQDIFTSHLSRLSLMLADRYFSSLSFEQTQRIGRRSPYYAVYANTYYKQDGQKDYKQQLDEHLIGVAETAAEIIDALPKFRQSLMGLDNENLTAKVSKEYPQFLWQNDAQKVAQDIAENTSKQGFFGINMASTGYGKTLANAKIMYALGNSAGKVRFSVALGLRTLTLQTGREFQKVLGLDDNQLSVAVGGIAVKSLFELNESNKQVENGIFEQTHSLGSESADETLNPEVFVHYTGVDEHHALYEWTKGEKMANKLLQAPVLVCTIDHLIGATEGVRSGQQIVPMLRLLSGDLILDEPDDFGSDDLPALCRLVHWAGMLGSRVLLSTATMPPMLAYACFEAYQAGWKAFAKANLSEWDGNIQCAWFDETCKPQQELINNIKEFDKYNKKFVNQRLVELEKVAPKRLGKIVDIAKVNDENIYQSMANCIFDSMIELDQQHRANNLSDDNIVMDKTISFGLVRMANINPMIAVAKALLAKDAPHDTQIHYCIYHSRYPLLMRSHIEKQLDSLLKRKESHEIWQHASIKQKIQNSTAKHHIFVVIASPVAEVGRDHDYDWAIVEPSSVRSIVQLAGRVLRHRNIEPNVANIHLLNKNIKALQGKDICFNRPGFETSTLTLTSHELNQILQQAHYQKVTAAPKIQLPQDFKQLSTQNQFDDLSEHEHVALRRCLFSDNKGANFWWKTQQHWTAEMPYRQPFRQSKGQVDETCYLWIDNEFVDFEFKWCEPKHSQDIRQFKSTSSIGLHFVKVSQPTLGIGSDFWFDLSPVSIYKELQQMLQEQGDSLSLAQVSQWYGSFVISCYQDLVKPFEFYEQLGVYESIDS